MEEKLTRLSTKKKRSAAAPSPETVQMFTGMGNAALGWGLGHLDNALHGKIDKQNSITTGATTVIANPYLEVIDQSPGSKS